MSEEKNPAKLLPVVDYLRIPDQGEPYLEGQRCTKCSSVFLGPRTTCSKCFARGTMETIRLSGRGSLYVYTIVYRSFPGARVPFVSAVVDLDGGGTVKGNLIGVEPDPAKILMGMPLRVVFKDAGSTDKKGNSYLSYFFEPAEEASS